MGQGLSQSMSPSLISLQERASAMADFFKAEDLGSLPFFSGLDQADLDRLLDRHRVVEVPAGQTVVMEADWGETLMVVLSGLAKVRSFNADGDEALLSLIGAGDLLGEISVLDGEPRSADVVSLTAVRLLKVHGRPFQAMLQSEVKLAIQLARLEASRLRDLNRRFSLQRSDATTKVLDALAYLARKSSAADDPLTLIPDLPQGEIAIIAGLARETSSRTMSKLRTRGIVIEDNGCLRLASLDPLRKRGLIA